MDISDITALVNNESATYLFVAGHTTVDENVSYDLGGNVVLIAYLY